MYSPSSPTRFSVDRVEPSSPGTPSSFASTSSTSASSPWFANKRQQPPRIQSDALTSLSLTPPTPSPSTDDSTSNPYHKSASPSSSSTCSTSPCLPLPLSARGLAPLLRLVGLDRPVDRRDRFGHAAPPQLSPVRTTMTSSWRSTSPASRTVELDVLPSVVQAKADQLEYVHRRSPSGQRGTMASKGRRTGWRTSVFELASMAIFWTCVVIFIRSLVRPGPLQMLPPRWLSILLTREVTSQAGFGVREESWEEKDAWGLFVAAPSAAAA